MPILENGQTCLEGIALEKRPVTLAHNDYQKEHNEYNAQHNDALSDGDSYGKGTNHGGHTHYVPDCSQAQMIGEHFQSPIEYKNFDSNNGGSQCDIKGVPTIAFSGREANMRINNYNNDNPYGIEFVNTQLNVEDDQYVVGTTIRTPIECNPS